MSAFIHHEAGNAEESARLAKAMRAPDEVEEKDPLRAKMNAVVLQRQLNEPNLYDKEIHRAMAAADKAAERDWRVERLSVLTYLRTHGGIRDAGTGRTRTAHRQRDRRRPRAQRAAHRRLTAGPGLWPAASGRG